jgi:hypothetical protein
MNKKLLELIKKNFEARLQAKTGWGRNDVMAEFNAAVMESLLEMME